MLTFDCVLTGRVEVTGDVDGTKIVPIQFSLTFAHMCWFPMVLAFGIMIHPKLNSKYGSTRL